MVFLKNKEKDLCQFEIQKNGRYGGQKFKAIVRNQVRLVALPNTSRAIYHQLIPNGQLDHLNLREELPKACIDAH